MTQTESIDTIPPRLHFVNEKGVYVAEHIPAANYIFMNWVRNKYVRTRAYFGKDVYYWHLRHNLHPDYRKTMDLEFIQHVVLEHNQDPQDSVEKRHFNRAWKMYGYEIKYVLQEISKDKKGGWKDPSFRRGHPYAYAYSDKWFEKFPVVEQKLMYHGLKLYQVGEFVDLLDERAKNRREDYCKKRGLDPKTGKKVATKVTKS